MTEIRLHATASRPLAQAAYAMLEVEFEEDGLPLAITEVDEQAMLHRVDLYAFDDPLVRQRFTETVRKAGIEDEVEVEFFGDIDWVAKSLEGLRPVQAGRFLVHGSHDRAARRAGQIAIEIEAGLAFGTGHHGTTAGCLEMLDHVIRRRRPANVLDLGTGSGVLAIAVALQARVPVLATDIDPVATRVAACNVRLNHASSWVRTVTAGGLGHPEIAGRGPFDLIVANILARPLMALAPAMAATIAPGGTLVLSGILTRQRNAVLAAYVGQRFRHLRTLERGEWVTLLLTR